MSIKQEMIKQIFNKIIRESILSGELPTEKNVLSKFRTYILQHDPSKPYFNGTYASRGSDVIYKQINDAYDELYDDLSLLYKRCLELNKNMMANYILVEKQRSAVDNELKKLEEEAKALIILNNSPTYLNCVYDSFCDFSKVDQANTTAELDIEKNKATISYNKNKVKRIIQKPMITISYPFYMQPIGDTVEGDLFNMYDDYENTVYSRKVVMSNDEGCIMEVMYDYGEYPITTNKISFTMATNSKINCRIIYSPDNINVFDLPINSQFVEITSSKIEVNFPEIQCRQIKFIFMKTESDSSYVSGTTQGYVYDYTIKQLALYNIDHSDSAILQSLPLVPVKSVDNFSIGKISLQVDHDIPSETDIEYYVALEPDEDESPDWARISPINMDKAIFPNIIDFLNRSTNGGITVDMSSGLAEHELVALNTNGIRMYSIHHSTDAIIDSVLYKGVNASLVKTASSSAVPNVPDISEFSEETVSYYNITNGNIIFEKQYSEPTIVQVSVNFNNKTDNNSLSLRPNIANPTVIYLNGRAIIRGETVQLNDAINCNLKLGMNNLTIISYVPADTLYTADLGTNLINAFGEVYAHDAPMTLVDIFDLQNVVLSNDHSKYALYTFNGKTYFVVNDDNQEIKYKINYDYSSTEQSGNILFKAVFKRQPYTNTTPVLYRYVIYCE